jgi:hypothetical protein
MKERPIIFSGPMVRAILEGRKTQTRRVIKPSPRFPLGQKDYQGRRIWNGYICPYAVGDRLWVKETWRHWESGMCDCGSYMCHCPPDGTPVYRATVNPEGDTAADEYYHPWRSPIHMSRWASRITLEITGIRVERVQGISLEDARAEGINCPVEEDMPCVRCGTCTDSDRTLPISHQCSAISAFAVLWDSINAKRPGAAWNDNPWVWVIEFKRVS